MLLGYKLLLDGKVDDSQVLTNVPVNAKFTDTPTTAGNKHIPTGGSIGQILKNTASTATWQADSDTITTINGKTGTILKADITALGIPAQDTVYTHPATHSADMITDGSTNKAFTAGEKTKLSGIATGANNYSSRKPSIHNNKMQVLLRKTPGSNYTNKSNYRNKCKKLCVWINRC